MKLLIKNKFVSSFLGTIAVYLGIGFISCLNNFSVYITSYINLKDSYVTMHYGLFIHLIYSFANTCSSSIGGFLENRIGFFKTIIIGFIIIFFTNLAFIFQQNIWLCYVLSLIFGIGTGIASCLLGKNLAFYSPDKKGMLTGILGLGLMVVGAIFTFGGEKLINFDGKTLTEDEEFYPPEIAKRTTLYFFIGQFFIPVGLILALLLLYEYKVEDNKKEKSNSENNLKEEEKVINQEEIQIEKNEENNNEKNEDKTKEKQENELKKEFSKKKIKQVVKSFRYWRLVITSFFVTIASSFIMNTGRTFGALIGINGKALQFAAVIQTLAIIILMPILGMLADKKNPLTLIKIVSVVSIIPTFVLAFYMSNSLIFIVCLVIYSLNLVALAVSFGPFIMEVYGIQESVILSGIIGGFTKISDIITTVSAFIFSLNCEGEDKECLKSRYAVMYIISGSCCVISSILLFFETKDKFQYEDIPVDDNNLINKGGVNKSLEMTTINEN